MILKAQLILLPILLLFCSIVNAQKYICIPDESVGFVYSKHVKKWVRTVFDLKKKYLISVAQLPGYKHSVTILGKSRALFNCEKGFSKAGYLLCRGGPGDFKFNNKNGRYLLAVTYGYFNVVPAVNKVTDRKSVTPSLEIGKCSPF